MKRHRGFPSRLRGTDFHFTLRREAKAGATPLKPRERYRDRKPADRRADEAFLAALIAQFGEAPFERGNLDAGRLSWLFGREVVAAEDPFDPESYDSLLKLDMTQVRASFPDLAEAGDGLWNEEAE